MINRYLLLFKCTGLFFLFLCLSFSVIVINKWKITTEYTPSMCIRFQNPIIKMSGIYYRGIIHAHYLTSYTDNLLNPVKLYYPPMYTIFTHTSKEEVSQWIDNITSKQNIINCLIDTDKKIGIIEPYNHIATWIFLLILSLISIVWIIVSLTKKHTNTPDINMVSHISETEIPPLYIEEDPTLPNYTDDRESYDRTPPSNEFYS